MTDQPRAREICEEIANLLNQQMPPLLPAPLNSQFEAGYNPSPYYDLKELHTLKVDVAPTGLKRPRSVRKRRAFEWQIDVVVQKQCRDVESQTDLINLADDMLNLFIDQPLRVEVGGKELIIQEGELFEDDLYDLQMRLQGNLFWTGVRLQLVRWP